MTNKTELRVPAIQVTQAPGRTLYSFAVDAKRIPEFATISRIHRNEESEVAGYQRPEVVSHIAEIRAYLESDAPMVPNAIVLAFDSRVKFLPTKGTKGDKHSRPGELVIPVNSDWTDADKPGFVVDGQQRLAAVREAEVRSFPLCVTAFITDDVEEQTEQFILVNSTKPLPKGLIYELLPSTQARLPTLLQRRRFPSLLMNRLNHDAESPLRGRIQTPTNPEGNIKDNSILRMLENSLHEGVLFRYYRDDDEGEPDVDTMLQILFNFWSAVAEVFPGAWDQTPKRSRLVHGAGIVSMGFIMDAIADRYRRRTIVSESDFKRDLEPIAPECRWTDGFWDFGPGLQCKWNEVQNTSKDIQRLSNFLLVQYNARVRSNNRRGNGSQRQVEIPL